MGQLDVTINKLGQLDLDNRTEYTTNFDIMKMAILAYFPVRENRMHFRKQDIELTRSHSSAFKFAVGPRVPFIRTTCGPLCHPQS